MDLYSILKFLHVVSAIAWVGGGMTLVALSIFAMRRNDETEALRVIDSVGVMAMRWFVPSALLTLVFGVIVAFIGNLWSEAWVILGLIGFAATFATGHFLLRPKAAAIAELKANGNFSEAVVQGRALLEASKFDYTMLFVVVALMVLKPAWSDVLTLGAMAVVLVVAGIFFLGRPRRPAAATA